MHHGIPQIVIPRNVLKECPNLPPPLPSPGQTCDMRQASVTGAAVRRLVQMCGIVRATAAGPTLAHVDVELHKNATGRGRVGHREVMWLQQQK